MALEPGTRFGPYEILAPIGAGGMGMDYHSYAVSPDGQAFLYFQLMQGTTTTAATASSGADVPAGLIVAKNWKVK